VANPLPVGPTLWARIRTKGSDNVWRFSDVSFTAAPRQASFTYPLNGATNVDTLKPFTWGNTSPGVQNFLLWVGSSKGGNDLVRSAQLPPTQTSYNVPGLPVGPTLWARIQTRGSDGVWRFTDISFTAAFRPATMTYPTDGATNVDTTKPFTWGGASSGVQNYVLYVGTTKGSNNVVRSPILPSTQTSYSTGPLPSGQTLWARVGTKDPGGVWHYTDVSFTAA
jgi:trimeric autotransporter adhesin